VAGPELGLLAHSIRCDGYTQPIVTIYDADADRYVIVDGFHRYWVMKHCPDIAESTGGCLPVVVLSKGMSERMASTVRHNRARGVHHVNGMAELVARMRAEGMDGADIATELGMTAEEYVRLTHVTGLARLYGDHTYNRAWLPAYRKGRAERDGTTAT